jgi:hypothetical protein
LHEVFGKPSTSSGRQADIVLGFDIVANPQEHDLVVDVFVQAVFSRAWHAVL